MRKNRFARFRRYDQWPKPMRSWQVGDMLSSGFYADAANPEYRKELRMISWRRPL